MKSKALDMLLGSLFVVATFVFALMSGVPIVKLLLGVLFTLLFWILYLIFARFRHRSGGD